MKEVGIVIVTYNRLTLLKEVIEALRLQTYFDNQIIVVNNGSTDDTLYWLEKQTDIITITQNNSGGAGGFFTGMKYVAEGGYKYCWLMDDDVICNPTALEELFKAYQLKKDIGFVCSKVIGIDGRPMNTPTVDDTPSENGYSCYYEFIDKQMIKVKFATFVSVFISTEKILELGLPYKEYFIWGDDSEYTNRVSKKYDSYLVCNSIVTHKRVIQGSLSFEKETNPIRLKHYFYMFRNTAHRIFKDLTYYRKVIYLLKMFIQALKYVFKGDLIKAQIIIKAIAAIIYFNPSIEYPKRQSIN